MASALPAKLAIGAWTSGSRAPVSARKRSAAARTALTASPFPRIRHRRPGLGGFEYAVLEQFDRDVVGGADERHVAVARRAVDRHPGIHQPLARLVDIVDAIGEVA